MKYRPKINADVKHCSLSLGSRLVGHYWERLLRDIIGNTFCGIAISMVHGHGYCFVHGLCHYHILDHGHMPMDMSITIGINMAIRYGHGHKMAARSQKAETTNQKPETRN